MHNHPTAEEVYFKVKEYNSTASKGTVYRNLKDLVLEKVITKISKLEGPDRYDFPLIPHHHLICSKCGRVFDFKYDFNTKDIKKNIENQVGENIDIEGFSVLVICNECKNKLQ